MKNSERTYTVAAFFTKLILVLALVGLLGVGLALALARTQPPLPPLVYAHQGETRRVMLECPLWAACEPPTTAVDLPSDGYLMRMAWSPDGATALVFDNSALLIVPRACLLAGVCDGWQRVDAAFPPGDAAWLPDGRAVYVVASTERMLLRLETPGCWNAGAGVCETTDVPLPPLWSVGGLSVSGDGRWLLLINRGNAAMIIAPTGCFAQPDTCPDVLLRQPSVPILADATLSDDGGRVVGVVRSAQSYPQVVLHDRASGAQTRLSDSPRDAFQPDWSADERWVVYASFAFVTDPAYGTPTTDTNIVIIDLVRGLSARATTDFGNDTSPSLVPPLTR